MGVVYHAHDSLLERDVAIKVTSRQAWGKQGSARLLREAGATAKLMEFGLARSVASRLTAMGDDGP